MSYSTLDNKEQQVKKILGNEAAFPDAVVDVDSLWAKAGNAYSKYLTDAERLQDDVEAIEDAFDAIKNGVKRVSGNFEKATFGLDPKKPDDVKKINQARKAFAAFFASELSDVADGVKGLDEVSKHVVQISAYKGPSK